MFHSLFSFEVDFRLWIWVEIAKDSIVKGLSTSIYSFPDLIEGSYLYVDKTAKIHELIAEFKSQYFLARPRRFGKSLLVSTLRAIFEGRRELFDGLDISETDYNWQVFPVIHLDLGSLAARGAAELDKELKHKVLENAERLGVRVDREFAYQAFESLVTELAKSNQRVVILVDEYDKPILNHLGQESVTEIQSALKTFYSVIKTTESAQRFVLLAGVSKFAQVSVFSDLNNLTDLTMDRRAASLLGYTQEELESNFQEYISALAETQGMNDSELLSKVRHWYNGYRFHAERPTVYNPVSVMKLFQNKEFRNYWFETGTPSFLLRILNQRPVDLGNMEVSEMLLSSYDPLKLEAIPLLLQTGYLTIQEYIQDGFTGRYALAFPNKVVEQAFSFWLAVEYSDMPAPDVDS